jgi:hypothetical protein
MFFCGVLVKGLSLHKISHHIIKMLEAQNIGIRQSIDDVKKSYPDEWILLGNPETDEQDQDILSGVVLYHSRDKRELAYRDKPLIKKYDSTALFFNRVTPRPKRSVIASIYSTLQL